MIEFRQVNKRYGGQVVLDRVDFRLLAGERAGIVGPNGAGKSTIFELITGESDPDSGGVERAKDIRIGHLRQQLQPGAEQVPIQAYVEKAAPDLETIRAEIHHIEERLAEGEDAEARLLLRRLGRRRRRVSPASRSATASRRCRWLRWRCAGRRSWW